MQMQVLSPKLAMKAELFTEQSCQKVLKELQFSPDIRGGSFEVSLVSVGPQHSHSKGKLLIRRAEPAKATYTFPDRSQVFDTHAKVAGDDEWYPVSVIIKMGDDLMSQPARIIVDPRIERRLVVV